ncbi:hypothetical protein ATANTOWER_011818 [Ataeniobius toweri]|uniref:Uncharacterized protein n=1 Tax=Ataeniobius toweri TaxID=208326 RepID=A0ABU7A5S8_9TELE|nr:hypothetical protein [Ataeniobius toweri]
MQVGQYFGPLINCSVFTHLSNISHQPYLNIFATNQKGASVSSYYSYFQSYRRPKPGGVHRQCSVTCKDTVTVEKHTRVYPNKKLDDYGGPAAAEGEKQHLHFK